MTTQTLTQPRTEVFLRTLGQLALEDSPLARPKPLLLLAYLSLEGPKDRRFLAELFFPESSDRAANLRQTLSRLRAEPLIEGDAQRLWTPLQSDAAAFLSALEARDLAQAVALYEGPFLTGVRLPQLGVELEEWVYATREVLAGALRGVLLTLAEEAARLGEIGAATRYAERAYRTEGAGELEPEAFEPLYALLAAGRSPLAAALRQEADGYGIALTLAEPLGAREAVSLAPAPLPTRSTSFVGRGLEQAELAELLARAEVRLLTLLGPGGVGKTSLALALASDQRERFADGVVFVPLEAVSKPAQLAEALASSLELKLQAEEGALEQVVRAIGDKSLLLVLDNLEHLLNDPSAISRLLAACPNLKLLVTSRERLNLEAEWVFPVEGLGVPPTDAPLAEALRHDAVQLFVQRAKRARLDFHVTEEVLPSLLKICAGVQGSPLGLELAAGWVKVLSCQEIAEQLQTSLDLLTATNRDAAARHESIRAVFESSWQRLSADEQAVFRKLAVFQGGFIRQAASEVTGATLPVLASLVDKSLLQVSPRGRYDRHMLLYQYAREKLAENPEEEAQSQERHAAYFLRMAEEAAPHLRTNQQKAWVERLEADLTNLRAAFLWLLGSEGTTLAALQMFNMLGMFFTSYGYTPEGHVWANEALKQAGEEPSSARAKLLHFAGTLSRLRGEYAEALRHYQNSLDLCRALDDKNEEARVLGSLAIVYGEQGDYRAAEQNYELVLAYARISNNTSLLAVASHNLGNLHHTQGHSDQARSLYQESLEGFRAVGNKNGVAACLTNLSSVAYDQGDYVSAMKYGQEGLELAREMTMNVMLSEALVTAGKVADALENKAEAHAYMCESLELSITIENKSSMILGLEGLALLSADNSAWAGKLWGVAEQARTKLRFVRTAADQARFDAELAKARAALGEESFAAAWEKGQRMGLEEAVAQALAGRGF